MAKLDVKPTPMDQGSSDGVLVCYQKIYSLVRLARKREKMIIKQKVIVEKEFWKPKDVSEKEWTEYWKKHADGHATNDDDFHKYHMEDSGADLEILETHFIWNETATKHEIPFTDEAIDKLKYEDIKKPKKINGIKTTRA